LISCSKGSKTSPAKRSPEVIANLPHSFLIVTMEISLRAGSIMLYTAEGVAPECVARALIYICLFPQIS